MTTPTNEIGYAQIPLMSVNGTASMQWWMVEDETTPELRWPNSVFVYDQMRRQDSQVVSVLRAVTLPVRRTPWRIDPAGARDEVVQLVAEDLGLPIVGREMEPLPRTRDRFSWTDHLRDALLMLPFGHSYFEQLYRIDDAGVARLRKLAVRMPKTIEQIDVARDGGLVAIRQYGLGGGTNETPIPVNRLVAYIHEGESGNWLGSSLLRPAYKNWLLKDRLLRVQAQTIERNGMGIPVYEAAPTERDLSKGLGLATSLRAGEAAGAAIPAEAKLRLMGVEGQLPDAEPAIRYHDEQIGRAVLAHFLNLGTQTGSWALGSTFADFFTLSLQTLAQQIADVATQHIIEDLVDLNFGDGEPAPKIVFDEIGSRQAATAEAIRALIDAGVITPDEVLEGAVRQQFGLPPKAPNADPEPAAEPDFVEARHDPAPKKVVAGQVQQTLFEDVDDDPIGELDDETLVVLQAMYELELERGLVQAAWNPGLHQRWPKGHPKAGKFKPMVDLLKEAIRKHDGKGHPFDHFKREQLMKAAKTRGITLKRGEDKDSIAAKLLADLSGKPAQSKPTATAKPSAAPSATPAQPSAPGVTTKPGAKWHNGDPTTEVHQGGDQLGIVVQNPTAGFFPFVSAASKKTPLGNVVRVQPGVGGGYQTEQSAVDALVRAHTPSKVSGPGLAGLSLAEQRIQPVQSGIGRGHFSKTSHEISQNGSPLGTVHDFSYGWEAHDAQGNVVGVPQGGFFSNKTNFKTKSEAVAALVSQKGTPATAPKAPATPNAPATPASAPAQQAGANGPEVQAALDIVYGKDPKAKTMARQIAVYGALRRDQFDQLGPREQSTVLGDLAFIATTSKGKSAADAANLAQRFTPAGTTSGVVHKQAIHVPPNVAAAQTRVADPHGTAGLLKVRDPKDRGTSGDGWTRLPGGGTGPWGKYGAAGVMLRHVDSNGDERFLMVQRGPGISDPGKWQFPGGAIDSKESPHEGAARETVEELGFKAKDMLGARVHGTHEVSIPNSTWKYTSIAATVDTQLKPDLSTHHARMETADAKWMTRDEIRTLDTKGKLLKPLAGGQLETNVISLFPSKAATAPAGAPGKRPPRLTGTPTVTAPAAPATPHKPSTGKNLIPDRAAQDKLRADVSAVRKNYRGKVADERLAAIGAMQGYDDVPTVVTKAEMDKLLATGNYIEAWRGVNGNMYKTAAQINEEMRSGVAYYGTGIFGNGYYLSTRKNVAVQYSDHTKNSVVRVLIPKTAKIEEHSAVLKKAKKAVSSAGGFAAVGRRNLGGGTLHDEGRYGAAEGLDGIEIPSTAQSAGMGGASHVASPGQPAYNWVNRSVLIIQEADA